MKVLVLGSGAREHAIVRALQLDPEVDAVLAAPGNPGIDLIARCLPEHTAITDPAAMAALAADLAVDLVVVGPEAPLVAGVADAIRDGGIACLGPTAAAAQLEGSKSFAKEVMAKAEVPTALAHVCTTMEEVSFALEATGTPYVVKEDGLAAGKGVVVTDELQEALEHARACLAKDGGRLVVEEFLDGPEVSVFCVTDGRTVVVLPPAQDFKRVGDDDAGPNTGGMGAYSPLPWAPGDLAEVVRNRIAQPTIDEMRHRGTPFAGILYVGLAMTTRGPRVVEFNARLGDPDGQAVLPRLRSPLGQLFLAAAEGRLDEAPPLRVSEEAAVAVVLASPGYPVAPETGGLLGGLEAAAAVEGVHLLHAGTRATKEGMVSSGGRVLCVVGTGAELAQARERAYTAISQISLPGGHCRTDIALAATRGEVGEPGLEPRDGGAEPEA